MPQDEVVELLGAGGMGEVYRARDSRLGRDVALKVLRDVLSRRHRKGIVHRDLKPENPCLTTGRMKILDFGLAKQTAASLVAALVQDGVSWCTLGAWQPPRGPFVRA